MPITTPDNRLYDSACGLLEASGALAQAVQPGSVAATPAMLGCLESALDELAGGLDSLGNLWLRHADGARLGADLHVLADALRRAGASAQQARNDAAAGLRQGAGVWR